MNLRVSTTPYAEFGSQIDVPAMIRRAIELLEKKVLLQRNPPSHARSHVRIVDIHIDAKNEYAVVLFRLIDKDAPDSVYEDFDDGELEAHPKTPTQGNRSTAHLAIKLKGSTVGDVQSFPCLLEVVPGISRTHIADRLKSVHRNCCPNAGTIDGESVKFSANFELSLMVERTIEQELKEGTLTHFTLEKRKDRNAGFDEDHLIKEEKRKIELKVLASSKEKLREIFSAVKKKAADEEFELIRAHYTSSEGRTTSEPISAVRQDALEQLVGKVTRIVLESDLHPVQKQVTPELRELLITLFKKKS